MNLDDYIRDIPDFPKPGIMFKDITPLLRDPAAFAHSIAELRSAVSDLTCDAIIGIESRGFVFGAALALAMDVGFIPVRKPGKLPHDTLSQEYSLEYGTDTVEIHRDAVQPGESLLIVDDLIATGGTAAATCDLVEQLGGRVAGLACVISLDFIPWAERLGDRETRILLRYE
jgi:adenine phosphoribosyltransferase